jgi:hypothetical protein
MTTFDKVYFISAPVLVLAVNAWISYKDARGETDGFIEGDALPTRFGWTMILGAWPLSFPLAVAITALWGGLYKLPTMIAKRLEAREEAKLAAPLAELTVSREEGPFRDTPPRCDECGRFKP